MPEYPTPLIPEHQSTHNMGLDSTSPGNYTPTEDEKKAIDLVNKLFAKAKNHRAKYDSRWLDNYKMFRGVQWKRERPSYRHSEVINMIFQNIQASVPMLTDARPRIEYVPTEPEDRELAGILSDVAESDWEKNNWLWQLIECIYDSYFYSIGYGHIGFDQSELKGLGSITFESVDPFYCYPDPEARDVNKKARYFVYAEPVDIGVLKKQYPQHAEHMKPDMIDMLRYDRTVLREFRYKSPTDSSFVEGPGPNESLNEDKILKITLFIKDPTSIEEARPKKNEDGTAGVEYVTRLQYPKGRKICVAGGVLLDDKELEFDDGMFPYSRLVNYPLPREFYGVSEVEQLESPQMIFNKLVSFSLDVLTLMGNPIWIVDTSSGVDVDNLWNRPGLVVEKEPGSEVRREPGVQLQPYVLQLIDRLKTWFDDVSGVNEVSRGVKPSGIQAGIAIESLLEANQTRIRQKSRFVDMFLQDVGKMYQSRVFQFYSTPRIFRVTNNSNAQKYFKMSIDTAVSEDGREVKLARVRQFNETEDGKFVQDPEEQIHEIKGEFDVRVTTGSSLPFSKVEKSNNAFQLFDRGIIDAEEVLKQVDYPNREAILERMAAKQQAAAEAQAQPQAGAPIPA